MKDTAGMRKCTEDTNLEIIYSGLIVCKNLIKLHTYLSIKTHWETWNHRITNSEFVLDTNSCMMIRINWQTLKKHTLEASAVTLKASLRVLLHTTHHSPLPKLVFLAVNKLPVIRSENVWTFLNITQPQESRFEVCVQVAMPIMKHLDNILYLSSVWSDLRV